MGQMLIVNYKKHCLRNNSRIHIFWGVSQADGPRVSAPRARGDSDPRKYVSGELFCNVSERHYRKMSCRGSILIESIVGISVSVIAMAGIFGLLSRSIAINKNLGQKLTATYLAAEGIEIVKSIIDANAANGRIWNEDVSAGNYEVVYDTALLPSAISGESDNPLLFDDSSGLYQYDSGTETQFLRTAKISDISSDEIEVVSEVVWTERGISKIVSLEDHFFNWR